MVLPEPLSLIDYLFIAATAGVFGLSALLLYRIFRKEESFQKNEEKTLKDYKTVLHHARLKARDIMTRATDESIRIYKDANITNEKIIEELNLILQESAGIHIKQFHEASDAITSDYKHTLNVMQDEFIRDAKTRIALMQKESDEILNSFSQSLQKGLSGLPEAIDEKIHSTLDTIDKDADTYRVARMEKMEKSIRSVFMDTYQEILGKSTTLTVHNDLIVEALEKAKKEGVFSVWQTKQ